MDSSAWISVILFSSITDIHEIREIPGEKGFVENGPYTQES